MKKTKLKTFLITAGIALSLLGCKDTKQNIKETEEYKTCIDTHSDLTAGKDYAPGLILVGFDEGTTEKAAREFIESHNKNDELMIWRYSIFEGYGSWAVVAVPEGKEIDFTCYFDSIKNETIVDYANPNFIFKIPDPIDQFKGGYK